MLNQQGDLKMMRAHHTRHSQLLFVLTLQKHGWLLVKLQLLHVQIYCSNKELALQSHDILLANAAQTGLDLTVIIVQLKTGWKVFKQSFLIPWKSIWSENGQVSCLGVYVRPPRGFPSKCTTSEANSIINCSTGSSTSSGQVTQTIHCLVHPFWFRPKRFQKQAPFLVFLHVVYMLGSSGKVWEE